MSNITGNGKNRQGYRELQIMNAKISLMIEQIFMDFLYDSFFLFSYLFSLTDVYTGESEGSKLLSNRADQPLLSEAANSPSSGQGS